MPPDYSVVGSLATECEAMPKSAKPLRGSDIEEWRVQCDQVKYVVSSQMLIISSKVEFLYVMCVTVSNNNDTKFKGSQVA